MTTPHIILLGYGALDTLQLTVETQRTLARYGAAYSLGLPQNLARFLKSQRVKVTDLASRLAPGTPFGDGYVEIAHFLLERTAHERPVIFLAPGDPMIFNAIGRYVAMEGRRLGLQVQAAPGVSPLDVIIGAIGLDVSTFGLQVFDATRLVSRRMSVNPAVPLVVLNPAAFDLAEVPAASVAPDLRPLLDHLSGCYPPAHPVVVVRVRPDSTSVGIATLPLHDLAGAASSIGPGAHLFIDRLRQPQA